MPYQSTKDSIGFVKGYITIFQGETYPYSGWFRTNHGKYSQVFGWYFPSDVEVPDDIPDTLFPVVLNWKEIAVCEDVLKSDEEVREIVDSLLYPEIEGEWVGRVGERVNVFLTIKKVITLGSYYGDSYMHIMKDDGGNTYLWTTTSKKLTEGQEYCIRGTIKDLKIYRGKRQNILSNCRLIN